MLNYNDMGNASSAGDGNGINNPNGNSVGPSYDQDKVGYRVLGVQQDSPASACNFVIYFDFIVAANGVRLRTLDSTFVDIIQAHEDAPLGLTVYNSKARTTREVTMVPSRTSWSGDGLLGVTIRFDSYANADENVCRVVAVGAGGEGGAGGDGDSPAELAGLLGDGTDYILGSAERVYSDMDVLNADLQANLDRPMELFVYSSRSDTVRVVVVMPTTDWGSSSSGSGSGSAGDKGILGATIAHGYLHGLPTFRAAVEAGEAATEKQEEERSPEDSSAMQQQQKLDGSSASNSNGSAAGCGGKTSNINAGGGSGSPGRSAEDSAEGHIKVTQSPFGAHHKHAHTQQQAPEQDKQDA